MASITEGEIFAGKYKVERVLARGGMGVVVAAIHTQLDQRVALKFMLPEIGSDDTTRSRFLREARAAVRLRSEHVARVLDVGTSDGSPFIVMEYLEGKDLASVLQERHRLPDEEAVGYVLQAAEAVAEAHALGIIHRDLKPANLFLTHRNDGTPCVKVIDFGISKPTQEIGSLTRTSSLVGSPHYMAPEQIRSSRSVDMRSDIWAMGMILYELLSGVVAFARETLPELCSAIILDPIPPLREVVPDLPPGLEGVVLRALAKAPEHRPQTLAELADELSPFTPDGAASARRIHKILRRQSDPLISTPTVVGPVSDASPAFVESSPARANANVDSARLATKVEARVVLQTNRTSEIADTEPPPSATPPVSPPTLRLGVVASVPTESIVTDVALEIPKDEPLVWRARRFSAIALLLLLVASGTIVLLARKSTSATTTQPEGPRPVEAPSTVPPAETASTLVSDPTADPPPPLEPLPPDDPPSSTQPTTTPPKPILRGAAQPHPTATKSAAPRPSTTPSSYVDYGPRK